MAPVELQLFRNTSVNGTDYQHLRIHLNSPDQIIAPGDLKSVELPGNLGGSPGVVLEGRAPIWLYAYLVHRLHASAWVGCYDPRLEGAVIVESHTPGMQVGAVLALNIPNAA